jgi:hypothetical protein
MSSVEGEVIRLQFCTDFLRRSDFRSDMVRGAERSSEKREEFLHFKIDLPSIKFEISSSDPAKVLPELRQLLDTVQIGDAVLYEEFAMHELRHELSDGFTRNREVMEEVKKLLRSEEDYRTARVSLTLTATVDLRGEMQDLRVDRDEVRRGVAKLFSEIDPAVVKHGIVHLRGQLQRDDKLLVMDHIHRAMPVAQLRAFHSPDMTSALEVECVLFGEFVDEEE